MGHRTNRFRHPCNLLLAVLLQLHWGLFFFHTSSYNSVKTFFNRPTHSFFSHWGQECLHCSGDRKETTGRCTECAEFLTERLQEGCKRLRRNDERLACSQCAELLFFFCICICMLTLMCFLCFNLIKVWYFSSI